MKYDFDHTTGEGQKRLMYLSRGIDYQTQTLPPFDGEDYGADPIGDGTFRMVPSGEVVNYEERCLRLEKHSHKIKAWNA